MSIITFLISPLKVLLWKPLNGSDGLRLECINKFRTKDVVFIEVYQGFPALLWLIWLGHMEFQVCL